MNQINHKTGGILTSLAALVIVVGSMNIAAPLLVSLLLARSSLFYSRETRHNGSHCWKHYYQ